jgi:hypothetical protein
MFSEKIILSEIHQLPENEKTEVWNFISFLKQKHSIQKTTPQKKKRVFGISKGKYVLSSDFDAPLEDFKEYMYVRCDI